MMHRRKLRMLKLPKNLAKLARPGNPDWHQTPTLHLRYVLAWKKWVTGWLKQLIIGLMGLLIHDFFVQEYIWFDFKIIYEIKYFKCPFCNLKRWEIWILTNLKLILFSFWFNLLAHAKLLNCSPFSFFKGRHWALPILTCYLIAVRLCMT